MASFKEYEMMFKLSASLGSNFKSSFTNAQAPIAELQGKIDALNKTQSDISAYQKQQGAVDKTKTKLELLKRQYDNLQAEMGESGTASADLKNKMLAKQVQIDKVNGSLEKQTEKLDKMGSSLSDAGIDVKNLAQESSKLEGEIRELTQEQEDAAEAADNFGGRMTDAVDEIQQALAAAGIAVALKGIYDGLVQCAEASIVFESAMAGVSKTTNLSEAELAAMGNEFKDLSEDKIPATTEEFAAIAEAAGQLGIKKYAILDFSVVMSQLGTATNMTSEEAATMLAQYANITQMDTKDYDRLGSTIVDLGNNFATTEQKIVDMTQGFAASGDIAGMSEADMLGLAAAVSSVGIEAAAGGTSMSTLIQNLNGAVETKDGLNELASVAGMTADEFAKAWGEDAAGALAQFITGLNDTERTGKSATLILEELGITEVRLQRMMLSLAGSGDMLSEAIETANTAWIENTALAKEAETRYSTTESKLTMASNAANNLKIAIGDALTPAIADVSGAAADAMGEMSDYIEENPVLVQSVSAATGVLAAGTIGVTAYAGALKIAAAAKTLFAGISLGPVAWITAGIAGLTAGVILLSDALEGAKVDFDELDVEFDALNDEIEKQQNISDLCEEYKTLSAELDNTQLSTEELAEKEARLAEVKALLIESSNGVITATSGETEAFDEQVEALQVIADTRAEIARQDAYANIIRQSAVYAENERELIELEEQKNEAMAKGAEIVGYMKDGAAGADAALKDAYGELMRYLDANPDAYINWNNAEVQEYVDRIEDLMLMLTGEEYNLSTFEYLLDAIQGVEASSESLVAAHEQVTQNVQEYTDTMAEAEAEQLAFLDNLVEGARNGAYTIEELEEALIREFATVENGEMMVAEAMDYVRSAMASTAESADDMGESIAEATTSALEFEQAISPSIARAEELAQAYTEAYEAAYESISGQFELFEKLEELTGGDKKVSGSEDGMVESLQSQADYMEEYVSLLERAKELGVDAGLLSEMSDGSVKNAEALKRIVDEATVEDIAALNEAYASVQEQKGEFADTVAEINTNFSENMSSIQSEMADTVAEMNMSSEAAASAKSTLQAFADSAISMLPTVYAAYKRVANAAAAALGGGGKPAVVKPSAVRYAYADGTDYARRGFALVGENGPEIVWMNGGESVMTAGETASFMGAAARNSRSGGSGAMLNFAPVYNITGGNAGEIENILREHDRGLRSTIEEMLNEIAEDHARRAYA